MKVAEAIAKQMKDKVCYCCGRTDNITIHHLRDIHIKTKSGKGKFNGYILLCRDCHDFVEEINNKHKSELKKERGPYDKS